MEQMACLTHLGGLHGKAMRSVLRQFIKREEGEVAGIDM